MDALPTSSPLPGNPLAATAARLQPVHLALACRILSAQGHDDFNQGQVSSCQRGAGHMLIKRAMTGFDGALPGDMIACPIDGGHPPPPDAPPELPLHQAIYAARSDVGGIVHTHAEYATVFGATDLPVRPLSHEGSYFADGVPRFTQTSQTVLDRATGDAIARTLGAHPAVFLCNHGVVVVGKTIRQAVVLTLMLERACKLQWMAEALKTPYRISPDGELGPKRRFIYSDVALKSYWDHSVDAILRRWPDTADWTHGHVRST